MTERVLLGRAVTVPRALSPPPRLLRALYFPSAELPFPCVPPVLHSRWYPPPLLALHTSQDLPALHLLAMARKRPQLLTARR